MLQTCEVDGRIREVEPRSLKDMPAGNAAQCSLSTHAPY